MQSIAIKHKIENDQKRDKAAGNYYARLIYIIGCVDLPDQAETPVDTALAKIQRDAKSGDFLVSTIATSPHGKLMKSLIVMLASSEVKFSTDFNITHHWARSLCLPRVIYDKVTHKLVVNPSLADYSARNQNELTDVVEEHQIDPDELFNFDATMNVSWRQTFYM